MDLVIVALIGGIVGYYLGRKTSGGAAPDVAAEPTAQPPTTADRINRKLTKRQQRILESLPQDDPRPTLTDLIVEEATRLGIPDIPAEDDIDLGVRLAVFKRDLGSDAPSDLDDYSYVVEDGAAPPFEIGDIRLIRRSRDGL